MNISQPQMNGIGHHLWALFNRQTKEVKRTEYRSQSAIDNDNAVIRQSGDLDWVWVLNDPTWLQ